MPVTEPHPGKRQHRRVVILETAPHEHNYLIDHLDEIEAVIVDLSFNVQDDRWLVYCTACGHEHLDLPETDERISIGEPDPFHQAA